MSVRAADVKLSPEAAAVLDALQASAEPGARSILRRIRVLREILLANCLHGEVVKKGRIPHRLLSEYSARNLYVEDLPSFWRLLYTVANEERDRYVIILVIVDHRTYEDRLGVRRR